MYGQGGPWHPSPAVQTVGNKRLCPSVCVATVPWSSVCPELWVLGVPSPQEI